MPHDDALCRGPAIVSWIGQIAAAALLAQTLFFKFSGSEESVYIFSRLGVEPWGRYFTGTLEAVAVVLLVIPRTAAIGGVLAVGLMAGALFAHLTRLGIAVQGDGGLLFVLALVVLAGGAVVAYLRRHQLPVLGSFF